MYETTTMSASKVSNTILNQNPDEQINASDTEKNDDSKLQETGGGPTVKSPDLQKNDESKIQKTEEVPTVASPDLKENADTKTQAAGRPTVESPDLQKNDESKKIQETEDVPAVQSPNLKNRSLQESDKAPTIKTPRPSAVDDSKGDQVTGRAINVGGGPMIFDLKEFMVHHVDAAPSKMAVGLWTQSELLVQSKGVMNSILLTNQISIIARQAAEELKLIGMTNSQSWGTTNCTLTEFTLEEKCTKPMSELHNYPSYLLGKDKMAYSFYKFEMDKCFIGTLLLTMGKEIVRKRSYLGCLNILMKVISSKEEEDNFLEEYAYTNRVINGIHKIRYEEELLHKNAMETLITELTGCKNEYEDLNNVNQLKEEYVDKWEKSRNNQNHVMFTQRIEKLDREIKKYRNKFNQEMQVTIEVERYTNMVHTDAQKELVEWSQRYDRELEEKEAEIQRLTAMVEDMDDKLAAIRIKYEQQMKFIEAGRKLREELIGRKANLAKEQAAAIKIQAWWRGILVRRAIEKRKKKKRRAAKMAAAKKGGAPIKSAKKIIRKKK